MIRRCRDDERAAILAIVNAAAEWAIGFYRRHGFVQVGPQEKARLLRTYWTIPERQIETSVVLANPPLDAA